MQGCAFGGSTSPREGNAFNLEELGDDYFGVHLRIAGKQESLERKQMLVSKLFTLVSSDSNVGGLKDQVLENGVDVNIQCDHTGNTMLIVATKVGFTRCH